MTHRTWGWGAVVVDTPPPDWRCPACGRDKGRRRTWIIGRHTYLFGPPRCTPCAQAYYEALAAPGEIHEELLAPTPDPL